jgi:hypothetical protein
MNPHQSPFIMKYIITIIIIALLSLLGYGYFKTEIFKKKSQIVSYPSKIEMEVIDINKREYNSILKSNYYGEHVFPTGDAKFRMNMDPINYATKAKIYDVSYINYTTDFATDNGFPLDSDYINDDMTPGLKAFEFIVANKGSQIGCYMKFLIDSDFDIDMPQKNDIHIRDQRMRFPMEYPRKIKEENRRFIMNIRSGKNDLERDQHRYHLSVALKGSYTVSVKEFSRRYFKDLNYFYVFLGCDSYTIKTLSQEKSYFSVKKRSDIDQSNINNIGKLTDKDWYDFQFPPRLVERILPTIKEASRSPLGILNYNNYALRKVNYINH